jgi:hypothetical protein
MQYQIPAYAEIIPPHPRIAAVQSRLNPPSRGEETRKRMDSSLRWDNKKEYFVLNW